MAIAFEGFSIREYASKMRSVNVMKCWPFGVEYNKETQREEIESLLPPITCRKYRWWSKELDVLKSSVSEQNDQESVLGREAHVSDKPEAGLKEKVFSGTKEERLVMICPVCRSFSASTVNAVNVHIDKFLAQASREERSQMRTAKGKSRTAKKRSIVEIFAVAPQIETMVIDCEEYEQNSKQIEGLPENWFAPDVLKASGTVLSKEKKKNSKSKEDALAIVKKLKLKIKKKRKKKKKMTATAKKIASSHKREKSQKGSPELDYSAKTKSTLCNKRLEKKNLDTLSIKKRKVSRKKNLSMENQLKIIRASKLLTKNYQQELPVYPIQSILKNKKRVISCQKSSAVENIQDGDQTNSSNIHQLNRHVRFSGKDDILGPEKEHSSSILLTKSKSISQAFSNVMDASSANGFSEEVNKSLPAAEALMVSGSRENVFRSFINGIGTQSTNENLQLDDFHGQIVVPPCANPNYRSLPDKEKGFLDGSLDLTQAFQHHENFSVFNQDSSTALQRPHAGIARFLNPSRKEWCNPDVEPDAGVNSERVTNRSRSVPDHLVAPITRSAALDSLFNINANSQPLVPQLSVNTEANRSLPVPSEAAMQNSNGCGIQYQPFYPMSTKDLMTSIVEWKKQKTTLSRYNCTYDGFIGLPLNSQGELIKLHSSDKGDFAQLNKQNTRKGSASYFSVQNLDGQRSSMDHPNIRERHYVETAFPKDRLRSFSEQNFLKDDSKIFLSSEVGTKLQGTESADCWQDSLRGNGLSIRQLGLDLNLMNISACGCGKINQTPNETEKENIQRGKNSETCMLPGTVPTMRLMGKDVTVGRSNTVHGFEDGKICTDKEIITEHWPSMISDNSSASKHFQEEVIVNQVVGKAKENVIRLFEPQGNLISTSFPQINYVDNRFAHSYLGWQALPQYRPLLTTGNCGMKMQPFSQSPPSQGLMNRTLKFPGPCIPQVEPLSMNSHFPLPSSAHNPCQPLLLNSAQLKCNQNPFPGTSAFKFPFADQDCGEYVQPPRPKYSSQSLPQWMFNSTQQKAKPLASPLSSSDRHIDQHPCSMSGGNFLPVPSPHCTTMISHHPTNVTACVPHNQTMFGATSSAHRPLIPILPGFKPNNSISTSYRNRAKAKEKSKYKHFRVRDTVRAKKDKKRLADRPDALAECTKKPNLELEVEWSSMTRLNQSKSSCHSIHGAELLDVYRDKGRDAEYSPIDSHKDGFRTSSGFSFSNMDNMTRSGPIKLSAGAKHILKPSQKNDHDGSRPIHSTRTFGEVTNSYKVTEIQKKSAKIYRF